MEFAKREACVEHYQEQFPRLPRYMIQMALDYDLSQAGSSNEKPLTNKEKRKLKQTKKSQQPVRRDFEEQIKSKLENGEFLEFDCVKVVKGEDYVLPPMMKGAINVDGAEYAAKLKADAAVDGGAEVEAEVDALCDEITKINV